MDMMELKHLIVCDSIDRLVNIDYHAKGLYRIYEAFRNKMGLPLVYSAAMGMIKALDLMESTDVVLIGTGFLIDPYLKPETDGMVGAALLSRALEYCFGVTPVIVSEEEAMETLRWTCTAAEMSVTDDLLTARKNKNTVCLIPISKDLELAKKQSDELLRTTRCKLMVSIERPGANEMGVYHSALGYRIDHKVAKIDHLFTQVGNQGGFTVGVGDLGNELGVGNARKELHGLFPFGQTCRCGCGGGTITDVTSHAPVMGASSEIAVYGLLAALQEITGKPGMLCTPELQKRTLVQAALHGAVDGQDGRASASIDIMQADAVYRVVEHLHDLILYGQVHTANRPEFLEYLAACPGNPLDVRQ